MAASRGLNQLVLSRFIFPDQDSNIAVVRANPLSRFIDHGRSQWMSMFRALWPNLPLMTDHLILRQIRGL